MLVTQLMPLVGLVHLGTFVLHVFILYALFIASLWLLLLIACMFSVPEFRSHLSPKGMVLPHSGPFDEAHVSIAKFYVVLQLCMGK